MGLLGFLFLNILFFLFSLSGFIYYLSPRNIANNNIKKSHNFLQNQKIAINKLTLADIMATGIVSIKKAIAIKEFLSQNPQSSLKDLEKIPGIGSKTIGKLKNYIIDGGEGGI